MNKNKGQKTWMVRAGQGAFLINEFLEKEIVAIGWNESGKIPKGISYEELKDILRKAYPDHSSAKINQTAGQLWRFYNEFEVGDTVVTYDPEDRAYYVGTIKSEYTYNKKLKYRHSRKVEWEEGPHYRDELSVESKNLLGSILTIFEIPDDVLQDLEEAHPGFIPDEEYDEMIELHEQYEKEEEERIAADIVSRSTEFIKDQIVKLEWDEVERLVAGVLTGMGYKTRFTSRGADVGSDIIASPDGLAMVEPIIKVEVKHKVKSKDKVGAPDIRNFVGGLRNSTKGIYVSTTGFSKEAQYEAERANFHITLMDLDLLVELLVENYESLNPEVKALVPLKRIYWPV